MPPKKPHILLMGQTPPPWHGQAVATQILFEHDWPGYEIHRLRMEYSEEMLEVGRFQWKKIRHLFHLIRKAGSILRENPDSILFYPPASAKWVPFLRDVIFLACIRHLAGSTIFIFHASGLPAFVEGGFLRRILGRIAYHGADVALEVAQEAVSPHEVFQCKTWQWCPCAIQVPEVSRKGISEGEPITILFVGSLQEGKGVLDVLKTAASIKKAGHAREFKFQIVGKWFSSEFENEARKLAKELKLENLVDFTGQLTGDDKWQAYADADVFFFPTHYASEATPIVLMEALGMGLPVLSTQWAGIPAMLDGCKTAWLLPIHSPESYAIKLLDIHARRHELNEMHQASKAFYQKNFLPIRFIERVETAFQSASSSEKDRRSQIVDSRSEKPTERSPSPLGDLGDLAVQTSSSSDLRPSDSFLPLITSPSSLITDDCSLITSPSSIDPSHLIGIDGHRPTLQASQEICVNPCPSAVQFSSSPSHLSNSSIAPPYGGQVGAPGGHALPSSDSSSSDLRPSTFRPLDRAASSSPHAQATSGRGRAATPYRPSDSSTLHISVYLADQNPGYDRSFGISRMTQVILNALQATGRTAIKTISSKTSQQPSDTVEWSHIFPWGTRLKWVRLLTDHFHPLFSGGGFNPDLYYFPKGYMPFLSYFCQPSVVTIHDTIIQYDKDHYPEWRSFRDYAYWEMMLKHTLKNAGTILTVSESSKRQITAFMVRHALPKKEIHVTYEPCFYETTPQPIAPAKKNHVIHLASCEPHKRSAHLIRWWHEAESQGRNLPMLHLIGQVPAEVSHLLTSARTIVKRPFLEETALQAAYQESRALILPSEIEGFGLPALEAYYLGTPVCYVKDTSVEEILGVATAKGGFTLDDPDSHWSALDQVMAMSPEETRECGLKLRETYAAEKVAQRMITVFQDEKTGRA
jgi:glycosyltransferase involved in cell wall biosynthesis